MEALVGDDESINPELIKENIVDAINESYNELKDVFEKRLNDPTLTGLTLTKQGGNSCRRRPELAIRKAQL